MWRNLTVRRASAVAFVLLLPSACLLDGSVGRNDPIGGGTDGEGVLEDGTRGTADGSTAAPDTAQGASGGGGSSGGNVTSGGPESATGGAATSSSSGAGSTASDRPSVCEPVPDDSECARCRKVQCCAPLHGCLTHDSCGCWWQCAATDQGNGVCAELCGNDGPLYFELAGCIEQRCEVCSTPPETG